MASSPENAPLVVLVDGSNRARVSRAEFSRRQFFSVQESPSDPPARDARRFILSVPAEQWSLFTVSNQTTRPLAVRVDGQLSKPPVVAPGTLLLLTSDGSDVMPTTPPSAAPRVDETSLDHNLLSGLNRGNPHPQYVTQEQLTRSQEQVKRAMALLKADAAPDPRVTDAATVGGRRAEQLLQRENHRGVQAPATIQPQGEGSGLDADTLRGYTPEDFVLAADFKDLKGRLSFASAMQGGASFNTGISGTWVDHELGRHTDVDVTGAVAGDRLAFNGTKWVPLAGGGGGVTDHGALTGLLDDDHTQYVHNTLARTISANHTFTSFTDISQIAVPADPAAGTRRLFVDSATGELSVRTAAGATVSLETGGGGGYTDEQAQDAVGGILVDSASVNFTYDDGTPSITATVIAAGVDHGGLGGLADDDHTQYILVAGTRDFTGHQSMGGNNLTSIGILKGGGLVPGALILEPDAATTQVGGTRGVLIDSEFTSMTGGTYLGLGVLPGLGVGAEFDSGTVIGVAVLAGGATTYVLKGTTASPVLAGVSFGTNGIAGSVIELQDTDPNFLNAFLFTNRQTFLAADGNSQRMVGSAMNDEPFFRAQNAGSSLQVSYESYISQPHFDAPTGGATGTVTGTEGLDGFAHFAARMQEYEAGWSMAERAGFFYGSPGEDTDGGTIDDEYVLKTRGIDAGAGRPSVFLAPVDHRWLIHCDDPTGVIAHAGDTALGYITGTPAAKLEVRGDDTTQATVVARPVAAQTAATQEWQDSAGTMLARVMPNGDIEGSAASGLSLVGDAGGTQPITLATDVTNLLLIAGGDVQVPNGNLDMQANDIVDVDDITGTGTLAFGGVNDFIYDSGVNIFRCNGEVVFGGTQVVIEGSTLFRLFGATSGILQIAPPAVVTSWTLTLPPNDGDADQVLRTDGAGVTTWVAPSSLVDHGSVGGLGDDDHAQYALLAGRSPAQTLNFGTAASAVGVLSSTTNATKGKIQFGTSAYDEANNRLGVGTTSPTVALDVVGGGLFTDHVSIDNAKELRLLEADANGTNFVGIKAGSSIVTSYTLTLPLALSGAGGSALVDTTGSGDLDWAVPAIVSTDWINESANTNVNSLTYVTVATASTLAMATSLAVAWIWATVTIENTSGNKRTYDVQVHRDGTPIGTAVKHTIGANDWGTIAVVHGADILVGAGNKVYTLEVLSSATNAGQVAHNANLVVFSNAS